VDYITGFSAALGVAQALVARELGRGGAHVRTSLSMGAQLVQFPFTVACAGRPRPAEPSGQGIVGCGAHYQYYRARDGWAFLACRAEDLPKVADRLGAARPTELSLSDAIGGLTCTEAAERLLPVKSASAVRVTRLDELRESSTVDAAEQFRTAENHVAMLRGAHPSGHRVSLPLPTWYRFGSDSIEPLRAAPAPGSDTRDILAGLGLSDAELDRLLAMGAAREGWSMLKRYLPR
jgi:crotonobetainyl-CoA:carnitine CoA-transferase CaiB-like acyl-CoA transferase